MEVARGCPRKENRVLFNGYRVSVLQDKKFLEMDVVMGTQHLEST